MVGPFTLAQLHPLAHHLLGRAHATKGHGEFMPKVAEPEWQKVHRSFDRAWF